jgi:hypothetical protein
MKFLTMKFVRYHHTVTLLGRNTRIRQENSFVERLQSSFHILGRETRFHTRTKRHITLKIHSTFPSEPINLTIILSCYSQLRS